MIRAAHVWAGASVLALALSLASCSDSDSEASSALDAGAGGAAGATEPAEGGAGANFVPAAYADAGAAGALPVCTTTEPSQCQVSEALVTSADRYCPYCRACALDEKNACPPYSCGPGGHNEMAAGQCCSTCVPNDAALCTSQQLTYADQRAAILQQYVAACKKDTDCASALVNTPCAQSCVAALTDSAPALAADLSAVTCTACPLQPPVSVRPDGHCAPATCLNGLCMVGASGTK